MQRYFFYKQIILVHSVAVKLKLLGTDKILLKIDFLFEIFLVLNFRLAFLSVL